VTWGVRLPRRLLPALPATRAEGRAMRPGVATARGPAARAEAFATGPVLDRPAAPRGHGAARDPELDARFGAGLAAFPAGQP
jgi:hypothetical protein